MYRKQKPLTLKGSTSSLSNNLSVLPIVEKSVVNYAVVHKSTINLVAASLDGSTVNHRQVVCKEPSAVQGGSTMVMQAKLLYTPSRTLLVITSQKGIQIFESDGTMLYWYALGTGSSEPGSAVFGRGICLVHNNTICVGTNEGQVLVFNIPPRGTNITLSDVLKGHHNPICDLAADEECLVSSDDQGTILVWNTEETFQHIMKISGTGSPCSSVDIWNGLIVGGYGSGHIRVFTANKGRLAAEVTAHARWINSIHIAQRSGRVLSVGEDSFVHVWQLVEGRQPEIQHKFGESVTDVQLVGGQFISDKGEAFAVTGYDSNEIMFYA